MKIPDEILPEIYDTSKKVYERKLTFSEGAEYLFTHHNLNANSAKIYIMDFKYMIEGKGFKRTLNAYSMGFFMKKIKDDYGITQLKISLSALQKHIHYYEETHNTTLNKLRSVYKTYLESINK